MPQMAAPARAGPGGSQELHLAFLCGWQKLKCLNHHPLLSPVRYKGLGSNQHSGQRLPGGGLTRCSVRLRELFGDAGKCAGVTGFSSEAGVIRSCMRLEEGVDDAPVDTSPLRGHLGMRTRELRGSD